MKFIKVKGDANKNLFRPLKADGSVSSVFWVRIFKASKGRLEESLKTEILGDARIVRDKRIAEWLGQKPRNTSKVFLVEEKFPEWLELKKIKAPNTYTSMEIQWRLHLQPFFGGMILDEVTESAWLKYVAVKRQESPDRKFFNDRKYLAMFLGWCQRDGLIQKLPKLEKVDPEVDVGKAFERHEIAEIYEAAVPDMKLKINMGYTMGMRRSEVSTLEWDQIDWKEGTIFLPAAKCKIRKSRTIAMSDIVKAELRARRGTIGSNWVFPHPLDPRRDHGTDALNYEWEKARDLAGVDGRFHDLRHTFITELLEQGISSDLIAEYVGASVAVIHKIYSHIKTKSTRFIANLVKL